MKVLLVYNDFCREITLQKHPVIGEHIHLVDYNSADDEREIKAVINKIEHYVKYYSNKSEPYFQTLRVYCK